MATISVTEDMATAMRLHALGWKSAFHPEVLAYGLAPEDLRSALAQRLRWAQGTLQVLLRENPLSKRGLSLPQRIQYFTTMVSYFDGFASLAFILSPIVSLSTGLSPMRTPWLELLVWLGPYLAMNRAMYLYVTHGISVRRSEQYSLALFPLWIKAVLSTLARRSLAFVVTPKRRQRGSGDAGGRRDERLLGWLQHRDAPPHRARGRVPSARGLDTPASGLSPDGLGRRRPVMDVGLGVSVAGVPRPFS
jgi:cellulose synthase (UDP-forming)